MHPDRGIVLMNRCPEGLSIIPDVSNTLTLQSSGTNDSPRDPLRVPITPSTNTRSGSTKKIIISNRATTIPDLPSSFVTKASVTKLSLPPQSNPWMTFFDKNYEKLGKNDAKFDKQHEEQVNLIS